MGTYLQLVRLPNVFTAAADSLAGWLLVTGSFGRPGAWVPLVLASACTYAGGIALNDVFDAEVDRIERPSRPIPSGRVSRTTAAVLGAAFMAAGVALAFASGTRHGGTVELLLVECVIAYNAGIKHSALGPEIMGSCRGLNFLLGMSNAIEFGGPFAWIATVAYGLFVAGVTWISRAEVHFGRQMTILVGAVFQNVALLGLVYAGFLYGFFMEAKGQGLLVFLCGELLLLGLGLAINARTIRALWRPEPAMIQRAVKFGILSLIWLHVGLLLAVRGPSAALAVAIFWLPAAYAGRWIYST